MTFSRLNLHDLKQNGPRLSGYHHSNTWKRKRQKNCGKLWSSSIHRYLRCYLLNSSSHQAFSCTLSLLYAYSSRQLIFLKRNRRVHSCTYRLILIIFNTYISSIGFHILSFKWRSEIIERSRPVKNACAGSQQFNSPQYIVNYFATYVNMYFALEFLF